MGKLFVNFFVDKMKKKNIGCKKVLSKNFKPFFNGVFCKCREILEITMLLRFLNIVSILGKENFWMRDSIVD